MTDNVTKKRVINDPLSEIALDQYTCDDDAEIQEIIQSEHFANFVMSIADSLEDGLTFDELLSSKKILEEAIKVLAKSQKQE